MRCMLILAGTIEL